MRSDVAALYVDPRGPYPKLVEHWYDEARDARTYAGPWPVVAHPPCGPWGRLRHMCKHQDAACGPHAVEMVRRYGGVLEHPEISRLWRACAMPLPGELPDGWGGRTYAVRQVAWGHRCEKPSWLYVVGVAALDVVAGERVGGRSTHAIATNDRTRRLGIKTVTASERRLTPPAFAAWLVELAAQARRTVAA